MRTTLHGNKTVYLAIEMSKGKWLLAFSQGEKIRRVGVDGGDIDGLLKAIEIAKVKLGLPANARVVSCYEAGRDGFWLHRFLVEHHIDNRVLDPVSIQVDRRKRRAKTDRIDAELLVRLLMRYVGHGERTACREVRVPSRDEEDARRLHRERDRLLKERSAHQIRIRSLLALHGVNARAWTMRGADRIPDRLGQPLPPAVRVEIEREIERWILVSNQLTALAKEQKERLEHPTSLAERQAIKLMQLGAVGKVTAWDLSHEFAWRNFKNRRQVGALAGLTGTPYSSGASRREQGISKAGNRRVRHCMVEAGWNWLRLQPQSELSQWYTTRFASGTARMRKIGIVALARKLLIAFWRYWAFDIVPAGAKLKKLA